MTGGWQLIAVTFMSCLCLDPVRRWRRCRDLSLARTCFNTNAALHALQCTLIYNVPLNRPVL